MKVNDKAPDFSLPDCDGNMHSLSDLRGKWVVLYFYPKDNTPGCTQEALDFSNKLKDFESLNAVVIGISKDSPKSHKRFIEKHDLKVLLLSDESADVIKKYGAWGKKKRYGKEYYGTVRSTFLIDPEGIVRKIWKNVRVKGHVDDVLQSLKDFVEKGGDEK